MQSLNTYTQNKLYVPHFMQATKFLAQYLQDKQHTDIYYYGLNRNEHGFEYYGYLRRFLNHFKAKNFDLKTDKPNPQGQIEFNKEIPISFFNSLEVSTPQQGDLIYLDSRTNEYIDAQVLESLSNQYELIYKDEYAGFLAFHAKAIMKYILRNTSFYNSYTNADKNISGNIFRAPNGIYIYKVR